MPTCERDSERATLCCSAVAWSWSALDRAGQPGTGWSRDVGPPAEREGPTVSWAGAHCFGGKEKPNTSSLIVIGCFYPCWSPVCLNCFNGNLNYSLFSLNEIFHKFDQKQKSLIVWFVRYHIIDDETCFYGSHSHPVYLAVKSQQWSQRANCFPCLFWY